MSTSLKDLRQEVGQALAECFVGTADSGCTSTSIIDAELEDPDNAATLYERDWVKVVSGDSRRIRLTDGYTPSTGVIAWTRALSEVPSVGTEYEIHSLVDPDTLDRLINTGLQRCTYIERETITVVAGQREYSLAAYTWLTRKGQVRNVQAVVGDTALEQRYVSLPWFEVREDAGVLILDIDPISYNQMILVGHAPYPALASDTAETDCPLEWAKAAAFAEVYRWLSRFAPGEDRAAYGQEWTRSAAAFAMKSRIYAPRAAVRIQRQR